MFLITMMHFVYYTKDMSTNDASHVFFYFFVINNGRKYVKTLAKCLTKIGIQKTNMMTNVFSLFLDRKPCEFWNWLISVNPNLRSEVRYSYVCCFHCLTLFFIILYTRCNIVSIIKTLLSNEPLSEYYLVIQ